MRCLVSTLDRIVWTIFYLFLGLLFAELAPVAAIVGGILGQEVLMQFRMSLEFYPKNISQVIKAISNKDAPHNNYFFYNPLESCGVVETIGY